MRIVFQSPLVHTNAAHFTSGKTARRAPPHPLLQTLSIPVPRRPAVSIGLADYWIDHRRDVKGQRWVTAYLLARVNYYGVKVLISLRGVVPQLLVGKHEAERFSLEEGAFYGNIFGDPNKQLDWNACRGRDATAGKTGDLKVRVCTEPDPNNSTHTKCGFNYAGDCDSYTGSTTEPLTCNFFDSDGWYNGCLAGRSANEGTAAKAYSEVITTYVKH